MSIVIGFLFGGLLAVFGHPITTWQYWVLAILFVAYGIVERESV